MTWEYADRLLETEVIMPEEYQNWNDNKEKYYSEMDMVYDYLWYENENGIHFIDRLYSDGIEDDVVKKRRENNELELHFKDFDEIDKWIKSKHDFIPNR